jgi:hypothetical protein
VSAVQRLLWLVFAAPMFAHAADGLTSERIDALPADEQTAWRDYLRHSREQMAADQFAIYAELERERLIDWSAPPKAKAWWNSSESPRAGSRRSRRNGSAQ